ncbi:hypothetical protein [Archangium sp.]|uniref:hypothetical protein n=1 Tax=Archangium sp. TaxID=1872627 RepID=UPI002D50F034|nr:hypothetical protein [Archangium sp.]HYO56201.1 hypothetical protein [Archangium sp.]
MSSTDRFTLTFIAPDNPVASGREGLRAFIEALELHIGELRPTTVEGVERYGSTWPYSKETFWKALEQVMGARDARQNVFFERASSPYVRISVNLEEVKGRGDWNILLDVEPFSFFEQPSVIEERSQRLLELVRAWASWYPVHYVMAHSEADRELALDPNLRPLEAYDQLHQVYWLNVLGPEMVKALGRERVLSTPAYLVEPLPPGNVLIVTRPTVADCLSEEARLAQARALMHLRPDLRLEEVMAGLRERSEVLAPVEPSFEPDVAELLDFVVRNLRISERPRKVAELNAWRSPEVDEWRSFETALPPDVESPARELVRYRRQLPKQLLEKMYLTELPIEPASLPRIDGYFWSHAYMYQYGQEHLVRFLAPMAGAFLGEVLVRSLGGCWVPRKNLYEAQVVVGDRVYLPFLRAQRYFQSRQAIIDRSLTKLYRVAERHRS